jgi:hypothetical protein
MCVKGRKLEDAQMLFAEMAVRYVSWNMMVPGYASTEMWVKAFEIG